MVALFRQDDRYRVLYTLRSEHLPNHKGQVAFPGGKREAGDGRLLDTALREANEEVGLDPAAVDIIGTLDDVYTMATQYVITPYVGVVRGRPQLRPDPSEVADVFDVPVHDLLDPDYHKVESRTWGDNEVDIDVITAGPHIIWGATHSITMNLIACLEPAAEGPAGARSGRSG